MTTLETLITQYGEACMESARNSGYDGADKHDSSVARMDAARAALVLEVGAGQSTTDLSDEEIDICLLAASLYTTPESRKDMRRAIAAAFSLAARQAGEPVAWMHEDGKRTVTAADKLHIETLTFGHWPNVAKGYTVPLYTHPAPQGQEGELAELRKKAARLVGLLHDLTFDKSFGCLKEYNQQAVREVVAKEQQ